MDLYEILDEFAERLRVSPEAVMTLHMTKEGFDIDWRDGKVKESEGVLFEDADEKASDDIHRAFFRVYKAVFQAESKAT
jgi:hypothetical protein